MKLIFNRVVTVTGMTLALILDVQLNQVLATYFKNHYEKK